MSLSQERDSAPIRKERKRYLRLLNGQPATRLEQLAVEWWGTLTPQERLEAITEQHEFQPGFAERVKPE